MSEFLRDMMYSNIDPTNKLLQHDQDIEDVKTGLADITTNVKNFKNPSNTWDDALSSAINYLRTKVTDSRGGKIKFPSGTYDLSPFTLPMRIGIDGDGIGLTVLRLKAGSVGNFITVNSQSLFSSIRNVTLDGNKSNCPQGLANLYFEYYSYTTVPHNWSEVIDKTRETADTYTYSTFENIISANTKGNGIEIYSAFWGTTFKNIFTYNCDGHGIYNATTDIFFDTIQTETSGLCGIYEGGSNNRWSNVKTIWNGQLDTANSAGMKVVGTRNLINNFEAQDNYCDGLLFYHSNSNQAYGVLVDGNGRVPGVADSTTGQMVGNLNCVGVRVKSSAYIRVKGAASNYKAPNCYLQNKAYIVEDDSFGESYSIEIDMFEKNQYTASQSLYIAKDAYYSDTFLFKGTTPTWDSNGLAVSTGSAIYFDKYSLKEQGIVEMIVNVSSTNSNFAKLLGEKVTSPYNQFYIQRDVNKIDLSIAYLKQDGSVGVAVTSVDLGTFPLNADINISGAWYKTVSDNSKGVVILNVKVNGTVYTGTATNISSIKSFITPKTCLGINHSSSNGDLWNGTLKFLQISDNLPNRDQFVTSQYTITKQPYKTGVYYNFQNYIPKVSSQIINYTDLTGEVNLPPAVEFYRGASLLLQDNTNGDYLVTCIKKKNGSYSWIRKPEDTIAYGDFSNKTNGQTVNTLDSGVTVKNFGNSPMTVQDGTLIHSPYTIGNNSAGYMQALLPSKLTRIGGEFIIPVGASGAEFVLVAPLIDWSGLNFNDAGVHAWSTKTGWVYGIRQGGSDIYLARGTYATPLVDDGITKYKFEISLNHRLNTATIYLPDGTISIVTDSRITSLSSNYALWELYEYNANPSTSTLTPFKISTVWASHNDDDIGYNRNAASKAEVENATGNILKTVPQMLNPVVVVYQPSTQADYTAPLSLDFVDATNAKISITPPLSGKILVEVTGHVVNTVAGSSYLMTIDTGGNGTGGNAQQICKGVYDANFEAKWLLTGVTQQPLPIDIKLKHFATTSGPVLKAGSTSGYFLVIKATPLP